MLTTGGSGTEKLSNKTSPVLKSPIETFRRKDELEVMSKDQEKCSSIEEEGKFVPKPPFDVSVTRILGLRRQGSARRRHSSTSPGTVNQSVEDSDVSVSSAQSSSKVTEAHVADCDVLSTNSSNINSRLLQVTEDRAHSQFFLPTTRPLVGGMRLETSGEEIRSRSKEVRSKVDRRSSSLGANLKRQDTGKIDQPQRRPVSVQNTVDFSSSPENKFTRKFAHKR